MNRVITIGIPARGTKKYVREAVESVLVQEVPKGWRLEIILVADGDDSVLEAVADLVDGKRLVAYRSAFNVGVYPIENAIIGVATGELIGFFGSDDVMLPGLVRACVEASQATDAGMFMWWFTWCDNADLTGRRPQTQGRANGCVMWRREVLDAIGGFENWRGGADTDAVYRAEGLGRKVHLLEMNGILYRRRPGQLTELNGAGGKPPEWRKAIMAEYEGRRSRYAKGETPHRVVPVCASIAKWNRGDPLEQTPPVHAHVATFPAREASLREMVPTILRQLPRDGRFFLHFNEYASRPTFIDDLLDERCTVTGQWQCGVDLGDAGKFFSVPESIKAGAYVLTCDDDILYPPDYIETTVRHVEWYKRRAVVGYHGGVVGDNGRLQPNNFRCIPGFVGIHACIFMGTGVLGFHASTVGDIGHELFHVPNMADAWFASLGQRRRLVMMAVGHPAGWLRLTPSFESKVSIWESTTKRDGTKRDAKAMHESLITSLCPWTLRWYDEDGVLHEKQNGDRPRPDKSLPLPGPRASARPAACPLPYSIPSSMLTRSRSYTHGHRT